MKPSRLKIRLTLLCSLAFPALGLAEWETARSEGRDYVTLASLARFYDLPAPPPLIDPTGLRPVVAEILPAPFPLPAVLMIVPSDVIELTSEKLQLTVNLRSREALINGTRQWLSFPVIVQDGQVLVSRIDLAKIIEPRFRPEKIDGLRPVKTVVLDPGHGGHDRGAVSRLGFEKDFALDVARRARVLLEAQGYKVVLTRSTDTFIPLRGRAAIANGIADSILVSIHFNYTGSNRDARGFEIYSMAPRGAPATNDRTASLDDLREEPGNAVEVPSAALAGSVYAALLGQVPMVDRGLKQARFAVLRHCTVPATLVECGFVSNPDEVSLINSAVWRARVAEAIVNGIDGYKLLAEKRLAPKRVADYRRAK